MPVISREHPISAAVTIITISVSVTVSSSSTSSVCQCDCVSPCRLAYNWSILYIIITLLL